MKVNDNWEMEEGTKCIKNGVKWLKIASFWVKT